jgi:hypothetical protein
VVKDWQQLNYLVYGCGSVVDVCWSGVDVCVCVCVRERERERKSGGDLVRSVCSSNNSNINSLMQT